MFNRILQRLGLVTLKNAKKINKTIVMAYSRAITEYSVRDFGVKGNPNQKVDEWANKAFDIIKSDPNRELVCEWEKKT